MQNLTPAPDWITSVPIAHRGFHDLALGRAENSMGSFHAAVAAGFAIECDLQVSKTGEPVVFHDSTLKRMTGIDQTVRSHSPADLAKLKLHETTDGIFGLRHHLKAVAGTVPLVLELKGVEDEDDGFVDGVAEALDGYPGQVAVMSFDHWILDQFRSLLPDIPRGLTAQGDDATYDIHKAAMIDYDLQFVSYDVAQLDTKFCRDVRAINIPLVTWTVKDEVGRSAALAGGAQMTFEGFDPRDLFNAA